MGGKKALVTGACGFIGSSLCEHLIEEGYEVRGTDLEDADKEYIADLDMEFVPADLTKKDTLGPAINGVDVIFHTAAIFDYSSLIDWEVYEAVNIKGTENLMEAARDEDLDSIINWSTSGVYGAPQRDKLPVTEDHPKNPESNYDRSKWLQEKKAREYYEDYGMPVKSIRPVTVYGPGNTYGAAHFLIPMANGQVKFYPLFCNYRLPIVHVEDVIQSAIYLDEHGQDGESYNIVDNQNYTMKRVFRYISNMTGNNMYGVPMGNRTFESISTLGMFVPAIEMAYDLIGKKSPIEKDALFYFKSNYWVSNEKIRDAGYEFEYPNYRKGLTETIEWYQDEGMVESKAKP
ncbi:MAG: NAD-dependent epimerase/dehydratase family protein [Halobacteria archaeon]